MTSCFSSSFSSSYDLAVGYRSPDARVYKVHWNKDWTSTSLGRVPTRRQSLPPPAEATPAFNVWTIIKDFVGKDITHLSVPAFICEPTCELQRRAEGLQCVELLDKVSATCFVFILQGLAVTFRERDLPLKEPCNIDSHINNKQTALTSWLHPVVNRMHHDAGRKMRGLQPWAAISCDSLCREHLQQSSQDNKAIQGSSAQHLWASIPRKGL